MITTTPRRVLVTGAASGLGRGIAAAFAARGDHVVAADISDDVRDVADELAGTALQLDISNPDAVRSAADDHAGIDILVNNAGVVGGGGSLADVSIDVFDATWRVNVRGTFLMLREFGYRIAPGGAIVNISSIGARQPTAGLGHYEATKAAVDALTRTAALELAENRVRVNAVAPGPVMTPLTAGFTADPDARRAWESRIPLGRIAEVDDIAPLVMFLASDEAGHLTGVSLSADGGQLLV